MQATMPGKDHRAEEATHPGAALRRIRTERGWTLTEVSRLSGLSVSTLSKIENLKLSLSYDKLVRLCQALDVDITRFFGRSPEAVVGSTSGARLSGRRSVTLAGEGDVIVTEHYRHLYAASDMLNKQFVPVVVEVHKRSLADFGELVRHPGEEYVYVLEGVVEVYSELYTPTRLNPGDSMYFDSGMGHAYVAFSDGPCRILSICTAGEQSARPAR